MKYGNTILELYPPLQFPRQIFGTLANSFYLCKQIIFVEPLKNNSQ